MAPANFTAEGAVFRLFPGDAGAPTKLLYESRNATNGDHLPTAAATEGAPAYTSPNALGFMLASAAPGTVALVRYYRQLPALRHLASVRAADVPADFLPEFIIGQVCPPLTRPTSSTPRSRGARAQGRAIGC